MSNRDMIKNFSEEEFIDWLVSFNLVEEAPWLRWLSKNYCDKCDPIQGHIEGSYYDHLFSPCEFGADKCPFGVADLQDRELIKLWLDAEI